MKAQTINLTGASKTHDDWNGDFDSCVAVGDFVSDEIADHFLEALPPAFFGSTLIQMGEPARHDNAGRVYWLTVQRCAGRWVYTGAQLTGARCVLRLAGATC